MKKLEFQVGEQRQNGNFKGWSVWKVHPDCFDSCCPVTLATFYGKLAKSHAKRFAQYIKRTKPNQV